jgi:hypothetical protein
MDSPPGPESDRANLGGLATTTKQISKGATEYKEYSRYASVIHLPLTPDQRDQLVPLVVEASRNHENILFIAAAVPDWSEDEQKQIWNMQVCALPAKIGGKIKRLIEGAKQ